MSRFELGMSLGYCSNWSVADAVREFFQNAKDEETKNPDNKMYFNYENSVLTIGNKLSCLDTKTLLLGVSTKRETKDTIGQFGEGYKVATVVLMRNGVTVKIYNNEAKEVWTSKVVKSRRYGTEIVVFDIEKKLFKKDYDLVFELTGITPEMYEQIKERTLDLQDDLGERFSSEDGTLLLDAKYSGNIYVNGLFVCHKDVIKWGYDLTPDVVKLDRDRGLVDTFDLKFTIARFISNIADANFIAKHFDCPDLQFVSMYLEYDDNKCKSVGEKVYEDFKQEYGEDAFPVDTTDEFNEYNKLGYNTVMVSEAKKSIIKDLVVTDKPKLSVAERYKLWRNKVAIYLSSDLLKEIDELWEEK